MSDEQPEPHMDVVYRLENLAALLGSESPLWRAALVREAKRVIEELRLTQKKPRPNRTFALSTIQKLLVTMRALGVEIGGPDDYWKIVYAARNNLPNGWAWMLQWDGTDKGHARPSLCLYGSSHGSHDCAVPGMSLRQIGTESFSLIPSPGLAG